MTWDKFNRKTQLFLVVIAIALLVLLWPHSPPQPRRPPARPAPVVRPQPQAARAAAPVSRPVAPAPRPAAPEPFSGLLGRYAGREMLSAARGSCGLVLELRRGDKPGEFSGFTRLVCTPPMDDAISQSQKLRPGQVADARNKASNPTLATLSGTAVDGSIRLQAVKNFGVRDARDGCAMTALSVTPAGTELIDVDWREATDPMGVCRGAQMQLKRFAR